MKDTICYYSDSANKSKEYTFNFYILFGKFFIHKQKIMGSIPTLSHFQIEIDSLLTSFCLTSNKKCVRFLESYDKCISIDSD